MNAEPMLISSILRDPDAVHQVRAICEPSHFADEWCRTVYAAACEIAERGNHPTLEVIATETGFGLEQLYAMQIRVESGAEARQFADLVAGAAGLRALVEWGYGLAQAATDAEPHRYHDVQGDALTQLLAMSEKLGAGCLTSVREAIKQAVADAQAALSRRDRGELPLGYTTGIGALDRALGEGGVVPGQMCVIGAAPGTGKTALGLHIFGATVGQRPGMAHVYATCEMPANRLARRIVASGSGATMDDLKGQGRSTYDVAAQMAGFVQGMAPMNAEIMDRPGLSVADVLAAVRATRAKHQKPVGVVVVDHLHEMRHPRGETGEERIRHTVTALRNLARNENVALVLLAQLNRKRGETKRPQMGHLRGAGAIEEAAHQVLLLYREFREDEREQDGDERRLEAIVAKNRDGGGGGLVAIDFDGSRQRMKGWDE